MSETSLVPRYDWFQNGEHVCITLYVKAVDPEQSKITIETDKITAVLFSAEACRIYEKTWHLAHCISVDQSNVTYSVSKVEIKLIKENNGLIKKKEKGSNLDLSNDSDEEAVQEGDVLTFFRQIYQNADEDTRRAMMKSFVESKGKVLSTDWKKVSTEPVRYEEERSANKT
eukprot:jgi/Galph1/5125/GphlegSOOS_G3784.1